VHGSDIIEVCRGDGTVDTVRTEDLVPGDVIIIPTNGCTLYCDAILLVGTCVVNESMLTGKFITIFVMRLNIDMEPLWRA
jgi:cation-transporting P-type ATPase 13A2